MNGLPVGSGVGTATIPRAAGLSTQADSVNPCAGGPSRPSCSKTTGTMWNCTSGGFARTREAAGLAHVGGQRALALHPLGQVGLVECVLERALVLGEVGHARRG